MKKFLVLLLCFISASFQSQAQTSKWFFTFSTGPELGGPSHSVKNYLNENGFNASSEGFLIFGPTTFPYITHYLPLLGSLGIQVTKSGSVYAIFGQSSKAEIYGYNSSSTSIKIKYSVLQFTGGYQLSFPTTRFKIGAGPSLFVLKYAQNDPTLADYNNLTDKPTTIKPGLSITGRMPFGKEKKLFGIELFFNLNLAPSAKFEGFPSYNSSLVSYDVNMINGVVGLSLAFRK